MKDIRSNITDKIFRAMHTGEGALPWSVQGVELVAAGATTTNPTPVSAGLIGEIFYLPFIVPMGHVLVILDLHIGSDATAAKQAHLKLKVTGGGYTNITIRDIIKYNEPAHEHHETCLWIPEGYSLRVDLVNASAAGIYIRYLVSGILVKI